MVDLEKKREEKKHPLEKLESIREKQYLILKECLLDLRIVLDLKKNGVPRLMRGWVYEVMRHRTFIWKGYIDLSVMLVFIKTSHIFQHILDDILKKHLVNDVQKDKSSGLINKILIFLKNEVLMSDGSGIDDNFYKQKPIKKFDEKVDTSSAQNVIYNEFDDNRLNFPGDYPSYILFSLNKVSNFTKGFSNDQLERILKSIDRANIQTIDDLITAHYIYHLVNQKSEFKDVKIQEKSTTTAFVNLNDGGIVFKNLEEILFTFSLPFMTKGYKNINRILSDPLELSLCATDLKLHQFIYKLEMGLSLLHKLFLLDETELKYHTSSKLHKNGAMAILTTESLLNEAFLDVLKDKMKTFLKSLVTHDFSDLKKALILNQAFICFPCAIGHVDLSYFYEKPEFYFLYWCTKKHT